MAKLKKTATTMRANARKGDNRWEREQMSACTAVERKKNGPETKTEARKSDNPPEREQMSA